MKPEDGSRKTEVYLRTSDSGPIKQNNFKFVLPIALNILHLPLDIAGWSSGSSLGS